MPGGKGVGNDDYRWIVSFWSGRGADQSRDAVAGGEGAKVANYKLMSAGRQAPARCMRLNLALDSVRVSEPTIRFRISSLAGYGMAGSWRSPCQSGCF